MSLDLFDLPKLDLDFDFPNQGDEIDLTMIGSDHSLDEDHARVQVPSTSLDITNGGEEKLALNYPLARRSCDPEHSPFRLKHGSHVQVDMPSPSPPPPHNNGDQTHTCRTSLYNSSSRPNLPNASTSHESSTSTVCHNAQALPSQPPPAILSSRPPRPTSSDSGSNIFAAQLHTSLLVALHEGARRSDPPPLSGTPPPAAESENFDIPPSQNPSPVTQHVSRSRKRTREPSPAIAEYPNKRRSSSQLPSPRSEFPDEPISERLNPSTTRTPKPSVPSSSQRQIPPIQIGQHGRTEGIPARHLETEQESSHRPNLKRSRSRSRSRSQSPEPVPEGAHQARDPPTTTNAPCQPPHKKHKTLDGVPHATSAPASQNLQPTHPPLNPNPQTAPNPQNPSSSNTDGTKTVPATPIPLPRTPGQNPWLPPSLPYPLMSPVPIICPSPNYAPTPSYDPSLPSSPTQVKERVAKKRLGRFLEREQDLRVVEGLNKGHPPVRNPKAGKKAALKKGDDKVVWETALGVRRTRRERVVEWLLNVEPAPEAESPIASTTSNIPARDRRMSNLHNQLTTYPAGHETRFLAVWSFLRYFYLIKNPPVADPRSSSPPNSKPKHSKNKNKAKDDKNKKSAVSVWDAALACLAISVRFHRDCLKPLMPIYPAEYEELSPHNIAFKKFEEAQRDVLSTCQYSLGGTPQPVMEELWASLPSLRVLLDFEDGWQDAMRESWSCLFRALREPDILKYPISLLTTAALMQGIIATLTKHILSTDTAQPKPSTRTRSHAGTGENSSTTTTNAAQLASLHQNAEIRAKKVAKSVFCDMHALVGVTDDQMVDCRRWMDTL